MPLGKTGLVFCATVAAQHFHH